MALQDLLSGTPRKLVAEFMGTFLLIFTVGCNVQAVRTDAGSGVFAALSIGSLLMIMIYALGPISGAHFNPAVTMSCFMAGKCSAADAILYILTHVFAGIVGSFSFGALYGDGIPFGPNRVQLAMFKWYQVLAVELLFTGMLCFVVLNTACVKKPNQYFGLAIGFVIVSGGNAGGWISGGAFNPAVSLGLDVSDLSSGAGSFGWSLLYIIAQGLGSVVAAGLFFVVRPEEFGAAAAADSWRAWAAKLTSEFVGTFMLVLTVGLNVLESQVDAEDPLNEAAVLGIAATLMSMIYAIGPVSGGHLNPAVTVAIFASGRGLVSRTTLAAYCLTQLAAGFCGAWMYTFICDWKVFELGPYGDFSWGGVAAAEFAYTLVLAFVVLSCATVRNGAHTADTFALSIGFAIVAGGYSVGHISGAALNPAVAFGIDVSQALIGGSFWKCVPYAVFQLLAAAAAAAIFSVTHVQEYGEEAYQDWQDKEMVYPTGQDEEDRKKEEAEAEDLEKGGRDGADWQS